MENHEYYIYILECRDKSYYVGHTDNIEQRLADHAAGMSHYTSTRLPVNLIYIQQFQSRDEAFVVERQLKGWSRKKKEAFIQKNFDSLRELSKCRSKNTNFIARSFDGAQDERGRSLSSRTIQTRLVLVSKE